MNLTKRTRRLAAAAALALGLGAAGAWAAGGYKDPNPPSFAGVEGWTFEGWNGAYDDASVQRGFQVYKEVCSSCHGMKLLSYRTLGQEGGPFYSELYDNPNDNPAVKAIAAEYEIVTGLDEVGDPVFGPAAPKDTFRSPYTNEIAARAANNGAYPPDMSVIVKARSHGADYIYSLLAGYPALEAIEDLGVDADGVPLGSRIYFGGDHPGYLTQPAGQYYNPYFPGDTTPQWSGDPRHPPKGGFLAMPPQLLPGRVEYLDGTEASIEQMSYDVTQFLAWASEPTLEQRKRLGFGTMIYLVILAGLLWLSYHAIWRKIDH